MTKQRAMLLACMFLVAAAFVWLGTTARVAASAAGSAVTLSAGQSQTIKGNGCSLSVPNNTSTLIKVKCVNAPGVAQADAAAAAIVLTSGGKLKVKSNACDLSVVTQKAKKVKITCTATTPPDATVHVGPNGTLSYSVPTTTIHVGQTVEWIWDGGPHTVTSGTGGTPDNQFCSPTDTNCGTTHASSAGAHYDHTFTAAGTFKYFCMVHGPTMSATVVVNP